VLNPFAVLEEDRVNIPKACIPDHGHVLDPDLDVIDHRFHAGWDDSGSPAHRDKSDSSETEFRGFTNESLDFGGALLGVTACAAAFLRERDDFFTPRARIS
jgi:hypothetical protein